jgi:hypothetical protein
MIDQGGREEIVRFSKFLRGHGSWPEERCKAVPGGVNQCNHEFLKDVAARMKRRRKIISGGRKPDGNIPTGR